MIEVFKTNVTSEKQAGRLVRQIQQEFKDYEANFDLDDCDRILRIKCRSGLPDADGLAALVQKSGFVAEVLRDECVLSAPMLLQYEINVKKTRNNEEY